MEECDTVDDDNVDDFHDVAKKKIVSTIKAAVCDSNGNTWVADQVTVVDNWDKAAYRQNDNDRSI